MSFKIKRLLTAIRNDFDKALAAHDPSDPRHPSKGGQHHNGPCCSFGNLNPSALGVMRQYVRTIDEALDEERAQVSGDATSPPTGECWCYSCQEGRLKARYHDKWFLYRRFVVCIECGNKRCPQATHHDNACTNSNEPGQPGSRFE